MFVFLLDRLGSIGIGRMVPGSVYTALALMSPTLGESLIMPFPTLLVAAEAGMPFRDAMPGKVVCVVPALAPFDVAAILALRAPSLPRGGEGEKALYRFLFLSLGIQSS